MKKLTTKDFIEKSKEKHGDKYNYSESIYVDSKTNVKIECPIHGSFWQNPQTHYLKSECPECAKLTRANKNRYSLEDFVSKASKIHENKYDYTKTIYTSSQEKVCINCPIHGEFAQLAGDHISGHGCPKCAGHGKKDYICKAPNIEIQDFIIENFRIGNNKEIVGSIYIFINKINNKKYIGKTTTSIDMRFHAHRYNCFKTSQDNYFYKAIRKYSWEGFDKYVIFQTETLINTDKNKKIINSIICQKEIEFISLFNATNPKLGYNLTIGGEGSTGYKWAKEAREKASSSRLKEGNPMFGKTLEKNSKSIPVLQLDLEGNIIKRWSSAVEVQNELGYTSSRVRDCYNKKCNTYKNYKWIKEKDYVVHNVCSGG